MLTNILRFKVPILILAALGMGFWIHSKVAQPKTTTTVVHDIEQVKVEVPVLTTKVIDHIIQDPKQQAAINKLMQENNELKLKVTQLTSTIAKNESKGGTDQPIPGTITPSPSNPPTGNETGGSVIKAFDYKDWQLNANYLSDGSKFSYGLSQTFIIETSTGTSPQGDRVGLVRLFQDTPKGLVPIPAKTTVIQANESMMRWMLSPRVQGGLGMDQDKAKGGFVGLQLLKRGRSKANEDIRFSVGTIGVWVSDSVVKPSLLPVSFNLGSIKRNPLTNLWVSPSIGLDKKMGFIISATF